MGLDEKIDDKVNKKIVEYFEKRAKKEKRFKYPFGKKVGKRQRKKNYVTLVIPYENGTVDFKKYQIEDQTVIHEGIPRLASAGYMLHDRKGNPLIILPNWSVEPYSPPREYAESLKNGSNAKGYKILMARMKSNITDTKKTMGNVAKWIIGLILAAIIGYALISGGGA